jgi:DNA-binding transcriptional LysR family regulator
MARPPRRSKALPSTAVQTAARPGPALDDWNLLRSFLAIYETGTLTEAALRLSTTQPSMGRHLRELEAQLGETLFTRLPGQLKPTHRAEALFDTLLPMRQATRDAQTLFMEHTASEPRVVGVVRIAVSEIYASRVLPQLIAPMLAEQPELEIELAVSNQAHNLLRRDADLAVRFFRPEQEGLIVRKVGETELGLHAHEDYLRRIGPIRGLEMSASGVLAGFDRDVAPIGDYIQGGAPKAPVKFRYRTDAVLARAALVEAGGGIAMMFTDVARRNPALRRVLADRVGARQEVWLCAHDELRRSARMRYVWERLAEGLERWLAPADLVAAGSALGPRK